MRPHQPGSAGPTMMPGLTTMTSIPLARSFSAVFSAATFVR